MSMLDSIKNAANRVKDGFWAVIDKVQEVATGTKRWPRSAERLMEATRRGDLEALQKMQKAGVKEVLPNGHHILEYASLSTAKEMLNLFYGASLPHEKQKEILINCVCNDSHAFEDPENITFCRQIGISMGLKDKKGNNILLKNKTKESINGWVKRAHISQVAAEFSAAAARDDVEMMDCLLPSGKINIDARVGDKTAFERAVEGGQGRAARYLMNLGARIRDPNRKDQYPFTGQKGRKLFPDLMIDAILRGQTERVQDLCAFNIPLEDPAYMELATKSYSEKIMDTLHKFGAPAHRALAYISTFVIRRAHSDNLDPALIKEEERAIALQKKLTRFVQEEQNGYRPQDDSSKKMALKNVQGKHDY